MGALTIALWITAFAGGSFFPPLFIPPILSTYYWLKQKKARKIAAAQAQVLAAAAREAAIHKAGQASAIDADALLKLVELRDKGVLTAEQFEDQKQKFLAR